MGFYGPPIFLGALHAARGWLVPLVSAAIAVHFLLGAAGHAGRPQRPG